MLHKEILSPAQTELLPLLKSLPEHFVLCGGTAIALYLGHRESIDFDLFTTEDININALRKKIVEVDQHFIVLVKSNTEYTVLVKGVKITFLQYPFPFQGAVRLEDAVPLPDLLTLSAMKAYALGRRSKWKDYVDLYFILSQHHSLREVAAKAEEIFGSEFNEKIFRTALSYFEDIDYSEAVSFRSNFEINQEEIRAGLEKLSTG